MGWLIVIDLALMTIATLVGVMVVVKLVGNAWQHRKQQVWLSPAWRYRTRGVLLSYGITIRCGAEALTLGAMILQILQ
jgi:hypothetical protein